MTMAGPDSGSRGGRVLWISACVALALGIAAATGLWRDEAESSVRADWDEGAAIVARPGVIILKVFGPVLY